MMVQMLEVKICTMKAFYSSIIVVHLVACSLYTYFEFLCDLFFFVVGTWKKEEEKREREVDFLVGLHATDSPCK
jgi:hypothetical protein